MGQVSTFWNWISACRVPFDMNVEWDLMSGSHSTCKSNGATAGGATFNGHVEWEPLLMSNGNRYIYLNLVACRDI